MTRDLFDPTPEQQHVVPIDAATLRKAEQMIESCQNCNPDEAEISFDWILDRVTGNDQSMTDYVMAEPAKCPRNSSTFKFGATDMVVGRTWSRRRPFFDIGPHLERQRSRRLKRSASAPR